MPIYDSTYGNIIDFSQKFSAAKRYFQYSFILISCAKRKLMALCLIWETDIMKIEDCRTFEIGNIGYMLASFQDQEVVYFQHDKIVPELIRDITKYIRHLENPCSYLLFVNNMECFKLVTLTFICIECYINDILKMLCYVKNKCFVDYKRKDLNVRLKHIIELAEINSEEDVNFKKSGINQQLQEFEFFRNIIFHGGFYELKIFHKTSFSNNPQNCNIVDVVQALKIAIDLFNCFRYIVQDADIMPNTSINFNNKVYFEKVDVIYNKIVMPMYKFVFKHGFERNLVTELSRFNFKSAYGLNANDVRFLIRYEQSLMNEIDYSKEKTDYMCELYSELTKNVNIDKEHFQVPNYYL